MKINLFKKSDLELVRMYVEKNSKSAFGEVYNRYFLMVYKFVYLRVGDRGTAEDIVSDTFVSLIEVLKNYDTKCKLSTFIFGIANNKIKQHWQRVSVAKNVGFNEEILFEDELAEEESDNPKLKNLIKNMHDVLEELPKNYRNVLTERFINQRTIRQTAKSLGISEANVRVIQNRAIKKAKEVANKIIIDGNL